MTPTYPGTGQPMTAGVLADGSTVNHLTEHGRIIGLGENPFHWAARGDGSADDTAAFAAAEAAVGTNGTIILGAGTFILNDWTPTRRLRLQGAGRGKTVLKAKGGAGYAMKQIGLLYSHISDLTFDGNAKASSGLMISGSGTTGSQGHRLDCVQFANCDVGLKIETAVVDQADKNLLTSCEFADSNTGLWVNATNGQEMHVIGGSFDTMTTAVRLSGGTFSGHGFQVQTAGTAFLVDGGNVGWLRLEDVITEGTTTDILANTGQWPSLGVSVNCCTFQASTNILNVTVAGAIFTARQCQFNTGALRFGANDQVYWDEYNSYAFGAAWTPTGTNYRRTLVDNNGIHHYFNNSSTAVAHDYITGEKFTRGVQTKVKAGAPIDGDFFFVDNGMLAVDSTNNRLYVRHGGAWHFVALT